MERATPSIRSGSKIDHYAIEELVATSNTACIFRATDLRTNQPVALKIPHGDAESDVLFCNRFRREQEIGKRLRHRAVAKALASEHPSRLYLATEWFDGQLLRQLLSSRGKLPAGEAVKIVLAICDVLEYIHGHGVVHHDLKPENILVDAAGSIKVIDFGIAGYAGARRLTFGQFSQVMGTPDYISPEQVQGTRGDARSDIYAVGVILYEMLTGQTPFQGANALAIMNSRLAQRPLAPGELAPEISPQLEEIVYRALEPNPKCRYSSARQMAWDLQHQDEIELPGEERPDRQQGFSFKGSPVFAYGVLAMIPLFFFVLLYIARHG